MLSRFQDFDNTFALMDQLRRRMDHFFGDYESGRYNDIIGASSQPRLNVYDTPEALVLKGEVPGLTEKDIQLSLDGDVLTISGRRLAETPEGYSVHRRERSSFRFSRSLTLRCKVDAEKCSATVKHGILSVTMPKVPEAQPKKIAITAG